VRTKLFYHKTPGFTRGNVRNFWTSDFKLTSAGI
jgi:hypothetical protein